MKTVVCLGDSITNNQREPSYVNYWQDMCNYKYGQDTYHLIASGVNGETAYDAYDRIDTDVLSYHPDIVTLMYGHNDLNHSIHPRSFQFHLEKLIYACKDKSVNQIWLLTPNQVNHPLIAPAYTSYLNAIKEVAYMTQTVFIDIWKIYNDQDLDEIYTYTFDYEATYGRDYLHPNELGHKLIAKRLMSQLKKTK